MNESVAAARAGAREWMGLAVLALPCVLYSMDLSVLNVAVPQLTAALRPSSSQLLWIVDIYGFLLAGWLITMGTLGDRIGRRKLLLIGAAAFGIASLLAAFSTSAVMLIAARAVLVGGALLEHFWWGSVFLINVPLMIVLLALGSVLLPEFRDPNAGRLDLTSAVLSLAGSALAVNMLGFFVAVLMQIDGPSALAVVVTGYVILSLGLAPVFTLSTDLIIGTAPPQRAGSASGLSETSSELGGALGIAVLGSLVTTIYRSTMASPSLGVPLAAAQVARDTLGGAVAVAAVVTLTLLRKAGAPLVLMVIIFGGLSHAPAFAQSSARARADPAVRELGKDFISRIEPLRDVRLHYVRGGNGPALVLVHGFPQDWYAFHAVMPRLAQSFTVVAVDLPGVGRSSPRLARYDAESIAECLLQLMRKLQLGRVYIAGHDNGGMVAYTFARRFPDDTRGVMILDTPVPGLEPWEQIKADAALWHFDFHQTPELPEKLIAGRQFVYFRDFFNRLALQRAAISDRDVARYARSYGSIEQLRAGLEFYRRAYPDSEKRNAELRAATGVPIVLAGGDHSMGTLNAVVAGSLRDHGWSNVYVEAIKDSGHWVVDENPAAVAELIERYAEATD